MKKNETVTMTNNEDKAINFYCRVCNKGYETLKEANACEIQCLVKEDEKDIDKKILEIDQQIAILENEKSAILDEIAELKGELRDTEMAIEEYKKERITLKNPTFYKVNDKDVSEEEFDKVIKDFFKSFSFFR